MWMSPPQWQRHLNQQAIPINQPGTDLVWSSKRMGGALTCSWWWLGSVWSPPRRHIHTAYLCDRGSTAWHTVDPPTAVDPYTTLLLGARPPAESWLPAPAAVSQGTQRLAGAMGWHREEKEGGRGNTKWKQSTARAKDVMEMTGKGGWKRDKLNYHGI